MNRKSIHQNIESFQILLYLHESSHGGFPNYRDNFEKIKGQFALFRYRYETLQTTQQSKFIRNQELKIEWK